MTAAELRYGRRGGHWATASAGRLLAELRAVRDRAQAAGTWPEPIDTAQLAHPKTIAASRAHERTCKGRHKPGETCPAPADPVDLEAVWAGLARMARARRAAGVRLRALDLEALHRHTQGSGG